MSILNKLVLRHLIKNKKRTVVTIIGVILSAAMITAVTTLASSLQNHLVKAIIAENGDWHCRFEEVSIGNSKYILNNAKVEKSYLTNDLGYAAIETNAPDSFAYIIQMDSTALENIPFSIAQGRAPENEDEILLNADYAEANGITEPGGTITLQNGQILSPDGREVTQEDRKDDDNVFAPTGSGETYTVVGLIETPGFEYSFSTGSTAITFLDRESTTADSIVTVWATLYKPNQVYDFMEESKETLYPGNEDPGNKMETNEDLLIYSGVSDKDQFYNILYSVVGILAAIIMVGSISLIYNAFAISVSERSRQYGMFSSIGATPRQIRRSVFFEGLIISIIGVPIGILAGIFGIGLTLKIIEPLISNLFVSPIPFTLSVSAFAVILAAVLGVITIFISAYIPSRRAAKMTAIEAIRQVKDVKLNPKKIKTSKLTRKLFGLEGELGMKNLKRNQRRYRTTIISLCISIILFLTVSTFTSMMRKSSNIYYSDVNFDLAVGFMNNDTKSETFIKNTLVLPEINEYTLTRNLLVSSELQASDLTDRALEFMETVKTESGEYSVSLTLLSLSDQPLENYLNQIGENIEDYKDPKHPKGVVINTISALSYDLEKFVEYDFLAINPGNTLELVSTDESDTKSENLEIGALTNIFPIGVSHGTDYVGGATVIVSDAVLDSINKSIGYEEALSRSFLFMTSDNSSALDEAISDLAVQYDIPDFYSINIENSMRAERDLVLLLSVFTYGFIALITLIGISNVFNTISTNIGLRRKEFAMLKSVGMSPRRINRMLRFESLFYGLRALLFGIPIGLIFSYLIYTSIAQGIDFSYSFPWFYLAACTIGVFLIIFLTMAYATSKVRRENVIDALRQDT